MSGIALFRTTIRVEDLPTHFLYKRGIPRGLLQKLPYDTHSGANFETVWVYLATFTAGEHVPANHIAEVQLSSNSLRQIQIVKCC